MAVELIPNQLIKLYDTETFNQRNKRLTWDYRTYCQIVRDEQTTQFQVKVTPHTGTNLITNGDFTSNFTDWNILNPQWTISNEQLLATYSASQPPSIFQTVTITANTQYVIGIDVVQLIGNANGKIVLSVADGIVAFESITIDMATYSQYPGVFELYFNSGARTSVNVIIAFNVLPDSGTGNDQAILDNIYFYQLTTPTLRLVDSGGTTIETLIPFAQALDVITYQVEWAGKTEGTYRICITGVDDLDLNYLDNALALSTEGDETILLEDGDILKWYG